jgi:hypothetical protein
MYIYKYFVSYNIPCLSSMETFLYIHFFIAGKSCSAYSTLGLVVMWLMFNNITINKMANLGIQNCKRQILEWWPCLAWSPEYLAWDVALHIPHNGSYVTASSFKSKVPFPHHHITHSRPLNQCECPNTIQIPYSVHHLTDVCFNSFCYFLLSSSRCRISQSYTSITKKKFTL